jgi:hypothetical protein
MRHNSDCLNVPAPRRRQRCGNVFYRLSRANLAPPSAMPATISSLPAIPTAIAVIVIPIPAVARPGLTIVPAVPILLEIPALPRYRGAISSDLSRPGTAA